jgi:Tfp pilus assembly protein PilF
MILLLLLLATPAPAQQSAAAETHFNAGLNHLQEGRSDLAIEEFKGAIKLDPKHAYAYKGLGLAYAQQNKLKEAIESFRKSLELNPYYVDVRNDLGSCLILSGKREEGKKEFLTAFNDATNPTPETAAHNLGLAYSEEKNYPEALNWFQTSLQRNKNYSLSYLGVANTLSAMGRNDDAASQLEIGVQNVPGDMSLVVGLGEAYYRAGRFTDARARLEEAARKDPGGPAGRRATELLKTLPK